MGTVQLGTWTLRDKQGSGCDKKASISAEEVALASSSFRGFCYQGGLLLGPNGAFVEHYSGPNLELRGGRKVPISEDQSGPNVEF